ncbi:MAG: bifunctional folylpolyglutamate synthase/dihydrofolate synthase [Candidatus Aminicenantales bacterium]
MNYEQCHRYLEEVQKLGIKFGLKNVKTILAACGNPHLKCPCVLVGGTNGKGSVSAMLSHILSRHGLSPGLYTSPHLVRVEERVRVGMVPIPEEELCQELTLLRKLIELLIEKGKLSTPPTYFELLTCLAFRYFARQKVDAAVLEVGMGGRFDATNVVNPMVSIITTVSRDHQDFLGRTLSNIAFEKAGIIKPGVPVVCGVKKGMAQRAIRKIAEEKGAPFFPVFDRKGCLEVKREDDRLSFIYNSGRDTYSYTPSLAGRHQGENAAVALVAAEVLNSEWRCLEKEKIIAGVEEAKWEARLEILARKPLVILDGAHNEEGAKALRCYVEEFIHLPLTLVVAFKRDKQIKRIADILFPLAENVIVTRFPFHKTAQPEEVRTRVRAFKEKIVVEPDVKQALKRALYKAGGKGCVLITGSIYLAGEVMKFFPQVLRAVISRSEERKESY